MALNIDQTARVIAVNDLSKNGRIGADTDPKTAQLVAEHIQDLYQMVRDRDTKLADAARALYEIKTIIDQLKTTQ